MSLSRSVAFIYGLYCLGNANVFCFCFFLPFFFILENCGKRATPPKPGQDFKKNNTITRDYQGNRPTSHHDRLTHDTTLTVSQVGGTRQVLGRDHFPGWNNSPAYASETRGRGCPGARRFEGGGVSWGSVSRRGGFPDFPKKKKRPIQLFSGPGKLRGASRQHSFCWQPELSLPQIHPNKFSRYSVSLYPPFLQTTCTTTWLIEVLFFNR